MGKTDNEKSGRLPLWLLLLAAVLAVAVLLVSAWRHAKRQDRRRIKVMDSVVPARVTPKPCPPCKCPKDPSVKDRKRWPNVSDNAAMPLVGGAR